MLKQEMFLTNIESLMPALQNLWSVFRRFLFSEETLPRLLISNAVTVVVICVISVEKCAYLFDLSKFLWDMFTSRGTVSSNMWNLLFTLSQMVMSGLRLVTVTSGGRCHWILWTLLRPNNSPHSSQCCYVSRSICRFPWPLCKCWDSVQWFGALCTVCTCRKRTFSTS